MRGAGGLGSARAAPPAAQGSAGAGLGRSGALCGHQRRLPQPQEPAHLAKFTQKLLMVVKCSFSEWILLQAQKNKQNAQQAKSQLPKTTPVKQSLHLQRALPGTRAAWLRCPSLAKAPGHRLLPAALQCQILPCWVCKRQ